MSDGGRKAYPIEGDLSVSGHLIVGGDIKIRGNAEIGHGTSLSEVGSGSVSGSGNGTGSGITGDSCGCGAFRDIVIWGVLDENQEVTVQQQGYSGSLSSGKVVFGKTATGWSILLQVGSSSEGLSVEGGGTGVKFYSECSGLENYGVRSGSRIVPFLNAYYLATGDKVLYYSNGLGRLHALGDRELASMKIKMLMESQTLKTWQEKVESVLGVNPGSYEGESLYELATTDSGSASMSSELERFGRVLVFDGFAQCAFVSAELGVASGRTDELGVYFHRDSGCFFMCRIGFQNDDSELHYNVWNGSVFYGELMTYEHPEFDGFQMCVGIAPKERGCVFVNSRTGKMYEAVKNGSVMELVLLGS